MSTENSPLLSHSNQTHSRVNSIDSSHQSIHSVQSGLGHNILPLPGMKIRAHHIGKNGVLTVCTPAEALSGAKDSSSSTNNTIIGRRGKNKQQQHYWIDIDADPDHAAELRAWLHKLNLPNFVIDVLAEEPEQWASQVIPLQKTCLAIIQTLPQDTTSDDISHLAVLALRNLLITFTSCPRTDTGGLYAPALARMKQAERLPCATSAGALVAWLRFHLDRTSQTTRELRYGVLKMDEAMDRDITSVPLTELIAAKDQALRLMSVAEEQSECLEALLAATTLNESAATTTKNNKDETTNNGGGLDFSSVKGSLASLVATTGATERLTLRVDRHIGDLRQRSEQHDHTTMNRRLAVLTVLSAIFLPLTLLTGIWGMNFQAMPELSKPYAYPLALMSMVSLASFMLYYFRRKGWFD